MNDNHILVVHSRWVRLSVQFYGYNFGGTCVFLFFNAFFSKISLRFWWFSYHTCTVHPLWGSQSMQELASGIRNVLPFLIRDAKSCIDCEPHKGCPRFAMKASIHLYSIYRVAQKKRNSQYGRFFRTLLQTTVIFFTLLDRASSSHYINTKIIKFGWELFIFKVISYGLSSSGFAWF